MTRVNLLLLLAVLASALYLVRTAYESRRLFTEIHRAETESLRLNGDHKRLEADRQLQANNLRVERTAAERLKMSAAAAVIQLPDTRGSAPAVAASGARP